MSSVRFPFGYSGKNKRKIFVAREKPARNSLGRPPFPGTIQNRPRRLE